MHKNSIKALSNIRQGLVKLDSKISMLETEVIKLNIIQQLEMLCNSYVSYRRDLEEGHLNLPEIDLTSLQTLLLQYQVKWGCMCRWI